MTIQKLGKTTIKSINYQWMVLNRKFGSHAASGLVDVDAGRLVDHASIDARAKNLDQSV
ncbi:MAG: hypothetical protein IPI17_03730 [Nitrosomonas sp.]|jgi:hypothetical protein|nr:hypothetical protein [Nitrosomonas sp.]